MLVPHYIELIQFYYYVVDLPLRGRNVYSFRRRPTPLFALWILSFMCTLNDNLLSRVSPRCFWFELSLISDLLKKSGGCVAAFFLLEKIVSCACLARSGLNDSFHCYVQSSIFNRSLLSVEAEVFTQFTMLNKEVSSTKSLTSEISPSGRSFI